ncbi:MAG: hypothetical protein AAFO63_00780 [Pseudomonadota bacterium]
MHIVDRLNDPGKGQGTGDDRFGFDVESGRAWVIDGSTDVGGCRVMASEESDAAWLAQAASEAYRAITPEAGEITTAHIRRALEQVHARAASECLEPLASVPRYCWPTGAGILFWQRSDSEADIAALGDCIGLVETDGEPLICGYVGKADEESKTARTMLKLTEAERQKKLQAFRSTHNTETGYWVYGLDPDAADQALITQIDVVAGRHVLLMSDGLFRLVSPYQHYSPQALLSAAIKDGLKSVFQTLRGFETSSEDDAKHGRFKTRDDACAVLIRF